MNTTPVAVIHKTIYELLEITVAIGVPYCQSGKVFLSLSLLVISYENDLNIIIRSFVNITQAKLG